jgi:hypothetical protein
MQFDRPEDDKPANANVVLANEFHNDLFKQKEEVRPGMTQQASLPDGTSVITPGQGGLIKDMKFPGTWTKEIPQETAVPGFETEVYSYGGAKDVFMSYKYRGGDPYITANAVSKVMAEPDHRLSQSEVEGIKKGLYDNGQSLPEYFDLKQARTETIKGRRILFVEGIHKQDPAKGRHALTAYIDSDPARPGRLPESVTYFVEGKDQSDFEKYRGLAIQGFQSMEFKPHVDTSNPL